MRRNSIAATVLLTLLTGVFFSGAAIAQTWVGPQREKPPQFGEIVAEAHNSKDFPDIQYTVPTTGVVQLESYDNDPKCRDDGTYEEGAIFYLNGAPHVPPASIAPCGDEPTDNLHVYTRFNVIPGDVIEGDTRDDSGRLTIRFEKETLPFKPPQGLTSCTQVRTDPQPSGSIPRDGLEITVYVDGITSGNLQVTWPDGQLTFPSQPFKLMVYPDTLYQISSPHGGMACLLMFSPNGLAVSEQPVILSYYLPIVEGAGNND